MLDTLVFSSIIYIWYEGGRLRPPVVGCFGAGSLLSDHLPRRKNGEEEGSEEEGNQEEGNQEEGCQEGSEEGCQEGWEEALSSSRFRKEGARNRPLFFVRWTAVGLSPRTARLTRAAGLCRPTHASAGSRRRAAVGPRPPCRRSPSRTRCSGRRVAVAASG